MALTPSAAAMGFKQETAFKHFGVNVLGLTSA
jgi:hypothetical protein